MDPHSGAAEKNTSHGNKVRSQDYTHLTQRPLYRRESLCQDPAGDRTTRRPSDHCRETQNEAIGTCLPFIRPDLNHLARHNERGKKTRETEKEVRIHQGMDRPGVRQVQEVSGEHRKMEESACDVMCGAPTTPAVKGWVKMKVNCKGRVATECA